MASLSRNLYDIPGLAPRMDALFCGQRDFQKASQTRIRQGTLEIVIEEALWSILSSPSTNVKWHSALLIYNDNPLRIRLHTKP